MSPDPDDLLAQQLQQLRREYLLDSSKRLEELRQLRARVADNDRNALAGLHQAFHRLAGSGGSYGFPAVTATSREGERVVKRLEAAGGPLAPGDVDAIDRCIDGVAGAFAGCEEGRRFRPCDLAT